MIKKDIKNKQLQAWYICDDVYMVSIVEYFPKPKTKPSFVSLNKEQAEVLIDLRMDNKYHGVTLQCDDFRDINGYTVKFIDDINMIYTDRCDGFGAALSLDRDGLWLKINDERFPTHDMMSNGGCSYEAKNVICNPSTADIINTISQIKEWDKPVDIELIDKIWQAYGSPGYTFTYNDNSISFVHRTCDTGYKLYFNIGIESHDTLYEMRCTKGEFVLNMSRELELFVREYERRSDIKSVKEMTPLIDRNYYWARPTNFDLAESMWDAYTSLDDVIAYDGCEITCITNTVDPKSVRFRMGDHTCHKTFPRKYDKEGFIVHVSKHLEDFYHEHISVDELKKHHISSKVLDYLKEDGE